MGDTRSNRPHAPQMLKGVAREEEVLRLAKTGKGPTAIGKLLGCSKSTAHRCLARAVAKLNKSVLKEAGELQTIELARLDAVLEGLWEKGTSGDAKSATALARVIKQRCELLGLNAPKRHEHAGPGGAPIDVGFVVTPPMLDKLTDEQLEQYAAIMEVLKGGKDG